MFSSNNNGQRNKSKSVPDDQGITIIGADCVVNGNISSDKPIRLDGKIVGVVEAGNSLIVGESGVVEGDIKAKLAVVYGKVKGDITVEKLELRTDGKVFGNITCQVIEMEAGAQYIGEMKVTDGQALIEAKQGKEPSSKGKDITEVPAAN